MSDTHSDKLLSDSELEKAIGDSIGGFIYPETIDELLDLINTQKKLYAESVIGDNDLPITVENKYSQPQKNIRNELRAEQRARIE